MNAPPPVFYKLNGFNQFIWKSHYLKSFVVPGLHSGKILGTQVTTKNKLIAGGGGDMYLLSAKLGTEGWMTQLLAGRRQMKTSRESNC